MVKASSSDKLRQALGLTFDDVLLEPAASEILPSQADVRTRLTKRLSLNIPILSAAMDTVTESRMAIAMARQGGIGIIHRNLSIERQAQEADKVKRAEFYVIAEPITVSPKDSLKTIFALRKQHGINSFPVVQNNKLVGLVTSRDLMFEENPETLVEEIMTTKLITCNQVLGMAEAKDIMHQNRIEKLPIVDAKGRLTGLVTVKDIYNRQLHPEANKDKKGRLVVGAAVGPNDDERVRKLLDVEVDVLVLDTSHGHSKNVVEATRRYKKNYKCELIAGNVATEAAAHDLIAAGADCIKVGVGPGAICTTRVVTGVGVPQISAVLACSKAAEKYQVPLISDGGAKYSGDLTKAIAAGAHSVMLGSLLAGCDETPGKLIYLNNRKYKQYRGMGSVSAMVEGGKERYFQGDVAEKAKLVPQGIEGVVPYKGLVEETIYQLVGGLRAGMGLCGAKTIEELRRKGVLFRVTEASLKESHPHDVTITEEAPNYY
ncbi:MAG TPA: IMP dehydrogenase [Candidatus Diapherotrites archaeon]|uniref:Inosine-5'-monophosphate dehydrogenase n=1 Tax=Candidatus Iainarchaeum sp. TaxID=3101447 RepID=A0A7J4JG42_9ARCH|nr:IMP dehydrogenase [Candidatus Diapherotrites archaeon]HIH16722.1 IMP dehydrogenase [Candidatus Diapherotrites archaeon]